MPLKHCQLKKIAKNENQAVTYENRNISDCDYITLIKDQQKHNQINVTVQFLRFNGSELYHGTLITIYSKSLLCHVFKTNGNERCPSSPRKRNVWPSRTEPPLRMNCIWKCIRKVGRTCMKKCFICCHNVEYKMGYGTAY